MSVSFSPVAPSAVPLSLQSVSSFRPPGALTLLEIQNIEKLFADTAVGRKEKREKVLR